MNWIRDSPPTIGVGSGTGRGQIGPVVSYPQELNDQTPLFLVTDRFSGEDTLKPQKVEEMTIKQNKGSIVQSKGFLKKGQRLLKK